MSVVITRQQCAICSGHLQNIYSLENAPIKLSCLIAPSCDNGVLSYAICDTCKTIQLDQLIPLSILYSDNHNVVSVGETWRKYFQLFCSRISPIVADKTVLEIGCPSGKIANQLDTYAKWIIVEPNIDKTVAYNSKVAFIETFFDEEFSTLPGLDPIDIIVHSHVFEHIYDPNVFFRTCRDILVDDGEMFFGIPDMQYIAEQNLAPFGGVMFEHTIFYNKENVSYLLKKHGFELLEVIDHCNHSILFHARKTNLVADDMPMIFTPSHAIDFFQGYNLYKDFIDRCKQVVLTMPEKKLYLFGASYNTQFLLTMGLADLPISAILDNCAEKQGKFLYGYTIQILSPSVISQENCIVILKNGYYSNEIAAQIQNISSGAIIIK